MDVWPESKEASLLEKYCAAPKKREGIKKKYPAKTHKVVMSEKCFYLAHIPHSDSLLLAFIWTEVARYHLSISVGDAAISFARLFIFFFCYFGLTY